MLALGHGSVGGAPKVIQQLGWQRLRTFMGAFGAPTAKQTLLYGPMPWMNKLQRADKPSADDKPRESLVKKAGKQVTGLQNKLKESQSYPAGFGLAAATAYKEWRGEHFDSKPRDESVLQGPAETACGEVRDLWPDAELDAVAQAVSKMDFIGSEIPRGRKLTL